MLDVTGVCAVDFDGALISLYLGGAMNFGKTMIHIVRSCEAMTFDDIYIRIFILDEKIHFNGEIDQKGFRSKLSLASCV